jgi:hypothetical protein
LGRLLARGLVRCSGGSFLRGPHGRAAFPIPLAVAGARGSFISGHAIDVFVLFKEVRYVEERIALQAQIDKCRLHAWQYPRHPAFVNASGERIFIGSLEVNLHELIIFQERYSGFVPIGRNYQFFAHPQPPSRDSIAGRRKWTRLRVGQYSGYSGYAAVS